MPNMNYPYFSMETDLEIAQDRKRKEWLQERQQKEKGIEEAKKKKKHMKKFKKHLKSLSKKDLIQLCLTYQNKT